MSLWESQLSSDGKGGVIRGGCAGHVAMLAWSCAGMRICRWWRVGEQVPSGLMLWGLRKRRFSLSVHLTIFREKKKKVSFNFF